MSGKAATEPNPSDYSQTISNQPTSSPTDTGLPDETRADAVEGTAQDSVQYESIPPDKLLSTTDREIPSKCIRECLEICFDSESIRIFCQHHFTYVFKRLNPSDRLDYVISEIIRYCEQRGNVQFEYLWQKIKIERKDNYYNYYLRWQKAVQGTVEISRVNVEEYAFKASEKSETQTSPDNLLAKNTNELTSWFFSELQPEEQSLLLSTALFEGMSRQKLVEVITDLEKILQ